MDHEQANLAGLKTSEAGARGPVDATVGYEACGWMWSCPMAVLSCGEGDASSEFGPQSVSCEGGGARDGT